MCIYTYIYIYSNSSDNDTNSNSNSSKHNVNIFTQLVTTLAVSQRMLDKREDVSEQLCDMFHA